MKYLLITVFILVSTGLSAAPLTPEQKLQVEQQLKNFLPLGSDPQVAKLVREYNAAPLKELAGMTQEKWAALTVLSPEVKALSRNPLAEYLKTKRTSLLSELFVNAANGQKVAFFGKTSSWSHAGKPKHDIPMAGKTWIGEPELDQSTGKYSVQIAFPVVDGGKVIGSIVIGLDMGQLK